MQHPIGSLLTAVPHVGINLAGAAQAETISGKLNGHAGRRRIP